MPPEESERGMLAVYLLIERQLHAAYRWQYEWVILFQLGIIVLIAADAVMGTRVDVMTLLGIAVLIVSGYGLARRERRGLHKLMDLYSYELDRYYGGRPWPWPPPWPPKYWRG